MKKNILTYILSFSLLSLFGVFWLNPTSYATGFNPGRIIEDSVFTNATTMTVSDIQTFLNSKVPSCDTNGQKLSPWTAPDYNGDGKIQRWEWGKHRHGQTTFTCLKDYRENGKSAARIIYDVAQKYTINPQVLIVLLQKEQALVTDDWPVSIQYKTATGYGCPDTAPCEQQYFGLTNQLDWAGKMFRAILNNSPTWFTPYVLGVNYIQYNPDRACGGTNVNIENRSTQALYNYTPYQPNAAALAAGYGTAHCGAYGNRNFYLYMRDWFGFNSGPAAFKTADSPAIYVSINGYKMTVPYMAVMQDYGVSVEAIKTVSQSYIDSIPNAPLNAGYSSAISHVVKTSNDQDEDGGSIYLISLNKRYQFKTLQQLFDFGFKESDIRYLPLQYIFTKQNGGMLPDFVTRPSGGVFKNTSGTKRMFFTYSDYISQNPSDKVASLSYYLADKIPSGQPISSKPVLVKPPISDSVYLYSDDQYVKIPDYQTYQCWGFDNTLKTPVYRIPNNNYASPISSSTSLSCSISSTDGSKLLLRGNVALNYSQTAINSSSFQLTPSVESLLVNMPKRNISNFVKSPESSVVWKLTSDSKRPILTYQTLQTLGVTSSSIDTIPSNILNTAPTKPIYLAPVQSVKTPNSSVVYMIGENTRHAYPYSHIFEAYGKSWQAIDTIDAELLNNAYPVAAPVADIHIDKTTSKAYILAKNGCFTIDDQLMTHLKKNYATLLANYGDTSHNKPNLKNCRTPSRFFKTYTSSVVYHLNDGKMTPILSYHTLLQMNSGKEPTVLVVSPGLVSSINQ